MDLMREKRRSCGQHRAEGGLFGGGGGSSSSSSQSTTQTDNRRTIASGGISAEDSTVNVLDGGAIKNAFDFGTATVKESFGFATRSQQQVLDSLDSTSNLVAAAYNDAKGRGALTDKILIGAIAMAGLVAVMALRK